MRGLLRSPRTRAERRRRRQLRVRRKVYGTSERPRLVVFRSLKHIYAQLIDDTVGKTVVGVSDRSEGIKAEGSGKIGKAFAVGELLGARAKEKGVASVVFDRAGYMYHGRVKAVADGARKGGLEF